MATDCVTFVPFSEYDWTFARQGWLPWNPTAFCLIAAFCGIAYWMCIELLVLVYVTFKKHTGLYFWSIIITTLGLILQTTGYILKSFENSSPPILTTIICKIGWVANVTGFSIVLWSRLHLVVRNDKLLKVILYVILLNGLLCHTPVIVFEFGLISRHHQTYYHPMLIMEKIQQTIFTLQETIISSLYIWNTAQFLNGGYAHRTVKVISLLVCVQMTVIGLDILLTVFDYKDMFTLKCTIHPFVYSIKLKLEFIVLNQLQQIVKRGLAPGLNIKSLVSPSESGAESDKTFEYQTDGNAVTSFITKARPAVSSVMPSDRSLSTSISSVPDSPRSNAISESEENDLKVIVGAPDDDAQPHKVDDLERQYLGRHRN